MNEAALTARLLKRLRAKGGYWRKTWGGPYAAAGVFDITGCWKGLYVEIEVKHPERYTNPKDGMTPAQWNHLSQIKANGGYAYVTNNEDELFEELARDLPDW